MFEYVRGKLIDMQSSYAVVDVQGVGYKLFIPLHLFGKMEIGREISLFTYQVVREDALLLYGFLEKRERDLFEKLLTISGIGPKTAMSLLGHLPLPLFSQAVEKNSISTFTRVPGIGKKTAERLLLELRGKVPRFEEVGLNEMGSQKWNDALMALINLGYSQTTAKSAIERATGELPEECDLSTLISHALKKR